MCTSGCQSRYPSLLMPRIEATCAYHRSTLMSCADSECKAWHPERGAAEITGHGRQHASAMAHQHAALWPPSLLPRPAGKLFSSSSSSKSLFFAVLGISDHVSCLAERHIPDRPLNCARGKGVLYHGACSAADRQLAASLKYCWASQVFIVNHQA